MSSGIGQHLERPDLAADRPQETPLVPNDKATLAGGAAAAVSEADAQDILASPKAKAAFFVAVRQRGLVNAMLEQAEQTIRHKNPGMATRWEYAPPNGDDSMVTARESQGFRVVHNSELGAEARRPGPVRRGDLILMIGPQELVDELAQMDARAAQEDLKAPEEAFRSSLEARKVTTKSGTEEHAMPFGDIKRTTEVRTAFSKKDGGIAVGPPQE